MQPARLLAASGTLALMTSVWGAVAHDITRRDRPYPADPQPLVTEVIAVSGQARVATYADPDDEVYDEAAVP